MPPVSHCFKVYIDTAFLQEIHYIAKQARETDVKYHCQADNPWTGFEVEKRRYLGHVRTLGLQLVLFNCGFFSQYRHPSDQPDQALP